MALTSKRATACIPFVLACFALLQFAETDTAWAQRNKYKIPTHTNLNEQAVSLVNEKDKKDKYDEILRYQPNIAKGGDEEDDTPRYLRHFFNPYSEQGLDEGGTLFTDAVTWARDDTEGRTWKGAIEQYGYTQNAKEEAYLRVGHVAHLIADMANPEHTHLEPHGFVSGYESSVLSNTGVYVDVESLKIFSASRMEVFLKDMAEKSYTLSSFPGDLEEGNQDGDSKLDEMFNVQYNERDVLDNQWSMSNEENVDSDNTSLGTWDGGTGSTDDDEWREITEETESAPNNQYFIENITQAIPAKKPVLQDGQLVLEDWEGDPRSLADVYARQLLPKAVEHIAGLYQFYHDIVNPPPYVSKVEVFSDEGGCIYSATWEDEISEESRVTSRQLKRNQNCNTPWLPGDSATIEVDFGKLSSGSGTEMMENVAVKVGGEEITGELSEEGKSWKGSAVAPPVSGAVTLTIEGEDAHNHYNTENRHPGDVLDSDPSAPAKVSYPDKSSPTYAWTNYVPGADTNHEIPIGATGSTASTADVALVLDRSGSMGFNGFIGPAKTSASNFVGLMQEGDGISVASFSTGSRVDFPFTRITGTGDVKSNAQDAIASIRAGGGTSIGAGMQDGRNELDEGNTRGTQGMVLLSDGFENASPFVDDVLPNIPDRINIYTIALGANSDQDLLNKIASETGGFFSFSPSESGLQQIYDDIRTQITGQQTIASTSGSINQGETTTTSALIDQSVSTGIFSVQWSGSDIDLTLTDPNGQQLTPSSANSNSEVSFSSGNAFESYTINNPTPGEWKLNVEGVDIPSGGEPFTTSVSGEADLKMNISFDEPSYPLGEHIFVRAEITDDGTPVTGADVTAEVTAPTQKSARAMRAASKMKSEPRGSMKAASLSASESKQVDAVQLTEKAGAYVGQDGTAYYQKSTGLTLYDDGDHGDGAANDGVYANFFDETGTAGSYTFDVSASGEAPSSGEFSREGSRSTVVSSSAPTDNCPGPLTIADFDAEQSQDPDTEEYVEIENTGPSPASLDECALVFFDGADSESYFSTNLTGTIGSGGTVKIGNPGVGDMMKTFPSNTLQNGPDAIALYRDDASSFPEGTPVTVQNLISSVVYISDDNIYNRAKSAGPTTSEKALMRLGEIADQQTVEEFVLKSNYPNPFGQKTTIRYALPEESDVEMVVYDVLGREVKRLTTGTKKAGWHRATLRAEDLSAGTYFVRLRAGGQVKTQSMKLVR